MEGNGSLRVNLGQHDLFDGNTVALWHLDETNGDNAGNDIFDATVNNYDGELNGTDIDTAIVQGISGKARNFDGTDDDIDMGTTVGNFAATDPFTVEAWINTTPDATNRSIIGRFTSGSVGWQLRITNANKARFILASSGSNYRGADTIVITPGWHHLVGTWDGTTAKTYLDGALDTTAVNGSALGTITGDINLYIGDDDNTANFKGIIDEVRISNVTRTAEEVAQSFRLGRDHYLNKPLSATDLSDDNQLGFYVAADRPGTYLEATIGESPLATYQTDANTLGLWHLDENTDNACNDGNNDVCDASGNGHHGDETGSPPIVQGKIGQARDFDGSADWINLGNIEGNGEVTITAWINSDTVAAGAKEILCNGDATTQDYLIEINRTAGKLSTVLAGSVILTSTKSLTANQWYHLAMVRSGSAGDWTITFYINGVKDSSTTTATNPNASGQNTGIGRCGGYNGLYFNGLIDEVRLSDTARSADDIRQDFETSQRTHPITIDFSASLSSNVLDNSSDTLFQIDETTYGGADKAQNIFPGDKIIIKEIVDDTEYLAQGTVDSVKKASGDISVISWDSGSTFPAAGYTANASVFKWQKESFDLSAIPLASHFDAIDELILRISNGNEGRTVWFDDLSSLGNYLTTPTGSTILSSTNHRYAQYRALLSSADPAVSATLSAITLDYVTDEPDGFWKLDENYGATAYDHSPNTLNATITGATWQQASACQNRACLSFDGSDDNLAISDNNILDPAATNDFTLSGWFKHDSISTAADVILAKYESAGSDGGFKILMEDDGDLTFGIDDDNTSFPEDSVTSTTANYDDNTWHHFTAVKDGTTSLKFYLDAVLIGTDDNISSTGTLANNDNFFIAIDGDGSSNAWAGSLDSIKYYRYARSEAEIKADYLTNSGPKGATANLGFEQSSGTPPVGYWPLDENTGTTTTSDKSGNNAHGTLTSITESSWVPGQYGSALALDGSADFVDIGTGPDSVNTIEFWVYPNTTTEYFINLTSDTDYLWVDSGTITATGLTDPTIYVDGVVNSTLVANQWQHVAITTATTENASNLDIGRTQDTNYLQGKIDEVRLYNYVRTPSQILEDINGGHPLGGSPIGSQVIRYKLDEQTNTTANNTIQAHSAITGSISGATWQLADNCKLNSCLDFDGSDDVVTVTNANAIDFDLGLHSGFTLSTWINADSDGENNTGEIFDKGTNTFCRTDTQGTTDLDLECSLDLDTTNATLNLANALTTNTWHHLTIAYTDDADDEISVYVDGILRGTSIDGDGSLASDTNNLLIGGDTSNNFDGSIDELHLYNTELTAAQIKIDKNAGSIAALGGVLGQSEKSTLNDGAGADPVGYWPLDENTGTTTTYDKSGNNYHAAFTSMNEAYWEPGKFGSAVDFRNTAYALVTDPADGGLDFTDTDDFSISLWLYHEVDYAYDTIVAKRNSTDTADVGYLLRTRTDTHNDDLLFEVSDGTNEWSMNTSDNSISTNTWHHIVVVFDQDSAANSKIYIDGLEDNISQSGTIGNVGSIANAINFSIGADPDAGDKISGRIDDVRVYNYALTPAQASYHYNRGQPVGWWRLDDCTGATASDASGKANNAAITIGTSGDNTSTGHCSSGTATEAWNNGTTGRFSASLDLDGNDDFLTVSKDYDYADVTVTAWFKSNDVTATQQIFNKYQGTSNGWGARIVSSTVAIYDDIGNIDTDLYSTAIANNTWYHLAVVMDSLENKLYLNGRLVGSGTSSSDSLANLTGNFYLGARTSDGSWPFNGQIDDVRIYNYALSNTQIRSVLNSGAQRFGP